MDIFMIIIEFYYFLKRMCGQMCCGRYLFPGMFDICKIGVYPVIISIIIIGYDHPSMTQDMV